MSEPRTHLIWSNYHRAWHRRSREGGACGYTDRLADAGLFEASKAHAYGGNQERRDKAIPAAEIRHKAELAIGDYEDRIEKLKAIIAAGAPAA